MMSLTALFLILASQTGSPPREAPASGFATGPAFRTALDQPLAGTWSNVELRDLLRAITGERRVALLLDRRVDPTTVLPIKLANGSLREGLAGIARLVGADVCVVDPVLFAGPPRAAWRLRTLIELRSRELSSRDAAISDKRRAELASRHTIVWNDLDSPADILKQITDRHHLTVRNPELIPHDLWAGCSLPEVTTIEALSLVLIQFDLTFTWSDSGRQIELVPIPDQVVVERRHRVKGRPVAEALKRVQQAWPKLNVRTVGSELVASGLVEQHEAIEALLNGSSTPQVVPGGEPTPIKQRQFTLKIDGVPIRALMQKLEESDIEFDFDPAELTAAGIDLGQTIKLDVDKASADEFFRAVFGPLGLTVEIDELTVTLTPKPK